MRILGIDPGLARLGWAVIEFPDPSPETTAYGSLATSAAEPLPRRLKAIHDALARVIAEHRPEAAAIEEIFFAANVKTAVSMAQARGVAILSLANAGVEFFEYSPLQIKQAVVGYGRASKEQVQLMVRHLLGLRITPKSDHATDALAAALCHAASLKRRRLIGEALGGELRRNPGK
ncbi:MAG: crossover junction endodeoxyribonuclease RuvC [Candidatus Sumerlaeota bacterium]|nr:crossover junction endodeoxyribonuclease RuvC [Candidatus Sumerlaeota bacterium]